MQRLSFMLLGTVLSLLTFSLNTFADEAEPAKHTAALEPVLSLPAKAVSLLEARRNPIVKAIQKVRGAVVNIHSERTVRGPVNGDLYTMAPSENRVNGMGTGIIIDPRGYIVTNQHVVEDVNLIRVRLSDGTSTMATVVARSQQVDIALLKINTNRPLPTMPLGTAKDLMVGETVIAIGNAYGYEHTVSRGIVSAVKRDVRLNKEIEYRSLIQTDASINPGNSGGPLVNIHGNLIGVNVAIRAGAQGIGFAIPVDTMIEVVTDMLRKERQRTASVGLTYRDEVQSTKEGAVRQVLVESVTTRSPAEESGLRRGDSIVSIATIPVQCSFDIDRALLGRRPGDRVALVYHRDGKEYNTTLVLDRGGIARPDSAEIVWQKLGLQLTTVEKDAVVQLNSQLNGGMRVVTVDEQGKASRAGIRRGDILVGLHQWETLSLENVAFVVTHPDLPSFNPLSFYIIRSGQIRRGWIQNVE